MRGEGKDENEGRRWVSEGGEISAGGLLVRA